MEARDSLIQQEARAYLAPLAVVADTSRAPRLRALLAEQTRALATLSARLDSVKQALPEVPAGLATGLAVADSGGAPASVPADWRTLPAPRSPWAVVGLLETTPSWSALPMATPGIGQEETQASLAQSVQLQRQLGDRWRVRAGAGQATLQTQARYTSERTTFNTVGESTTSRDTLKHVGLRVVMVVNLNTHDTSYQYITTYDTVFVNTINVRTRTITQRDRLQQQLRPEYRFWTLPFSTQYLLMNRNRWSLGLSAGGQLSFFRGGNLPVWNPETSEYQLRRVSARQGPYRPVSVSVSAGLEAQYRLTPRLSALLAPTLRWWALPPGKAGTTTTRALLPAAQLGLTYGF